MPRWITREDAEKELVSQRKTRSVWWRHRCIRADCRPTLRERKGERRIGRQRCGCCGASTDGFGHGLLRTHLPLPRQGRTRRTRSSGDYRRSRRFGVSFPKRVGTVDGALVRHKEWGNALRPSSKVRQHSVTVLAHLVLNDMMKVKGHISAMARCLEDEDPAFHCRALVFAELAKNTATRSTTCC